MNNSNNKLQFPKLIFEEFFDGEVSAKGHLIQYYPKIKKKKLFINFKGEFKKNTLYIKENYFEDNLNIVREWKFIKISNNYFIGDEKNVYGKIKVFINNNELKMKYFFKIIFKKISIKVNVQDDMYLLNANEIINSTKVTKYKIRLADTLLMYKKEL